MGFKRGSVKNTPKVLPMKKIVWLISGLWKNIYLKINTRICLVPKT